MARSRYPWKAVLAVAAGAGAAAAYIGYLRPRMLSWGATLDEAGRLFPGDELIARPMLNTTRAITIQAPAAGVWAWLVQIGQGRGGFYSYDGLENLIGLNIHSADRILPELQELRVGDPIHFWEGGGLSVAEVQPPHTLVLAGVLSGPAAAPQPGPATGPVGGTWTFILDELGPRTTRLMARTRIAPFGPGGPGAVFLHGLIEPAAFIMEQKMLRGIKERAERVAT